LESWSTGQVPGQPGPPRESVSKTKTKTKTKISKQKPSPPPQKKTQKEKYKNFGISGHVAQ
jgi:hypothetical protein